MSNTAFALSPISARATSPTEADFEAIREAFVETARGRWFLEEYTKRNRNADTALVLDAVARIERTLAAQKELRAEEPQAPPVPDLTETLAAIKTIIGAARDSAAAALSGPSMDEALAPTRKCARVIREIAWGLRESGADGRICSLLDSQVEAINTACDHIPTSGFRDQVLEAFDRAVVQIHQLGLSGEEVAEIPQPDAATVADETRNTANETVDEAQSASSNLSAHVSNDNNAISFGTAVETSLPEGASSADPPMDMAADTHFASAQDMVPVETMEAVTQAAQPGMAAQTDPQEDTTPAPEAVDTADFATLKPTASEHTPFEAVASEDVTPEEINLETSDGIALDESLFDLTAESAGQTSSEAEAGVAVQDTTSDDVMESSAAIETPADITVETAAAEEAIQQSAPKPESAASELEQSLQPSIAPVVATGEISVVPQVVESLEEMADIAIEETGSDEALDQATASEAMTTIAQDDLPSEDAPQIVEQPAEPVVINDMSEAAVSEAEQSAISDLASATPSEDAPSMAPDEVPPAPTKTPLPDIMIGDAVAQSSYSTVDMVMPVAVETATVFAADHMMSLAEAPTPDAITPPVSLGASLIASGIVAKPETPRNDPLAAIRRMSHAERIAFFS